MENKRESLVKKRQELKRTADVAISQAAFTYMKGVMGEGSAADLFLKRVELFKAIQAHPDWDGDKWGEDEKTQGTPRG